MCGRMDWYMKESSGTVRSLDWGSTHGLMGGEQNNIIRRKIFNCVDITLILHEGIQVHFL